MPIIKSAKKRVEINQKKNLENRVVKSNIATLIKKFNVAIVNKDVTTAEKLLPEVFSALDSASASNTIHANNAARRKAILSVKLSKIKA